MLSPGLVIFVLFFGVALLDAIRGGHWERAAFWVVVGVAFWLMERRGVVPRRPVGRDAGQPAKRDG